MENCCACAVEAHFNMVNPENQPTAQLPDWVLFSQGSLAAWGTEVAPFLYG